VQEKESNKKMKQYHDKRFAEEIRIKVLNEQQIEDAKKEEEKRRRMAYNQVLNQ
jgi:hypothetical protein